MHVNSGCHVILHVIPLWFTGSVFARSCGDGNSKPQASCRVLPPHRLSSKRNLAVCSIQELLPSLRGVFGAGCLAALGQNNLQQQLFFCCLSRPAFHFDVGFSDFWGRSKLLTRVIRAVQHQYIYIYTCIYIHIHKHMYVYTCRI